jgi:3',5'-cyclic AMP phosphodiesterase CpdA
MREMLIAQLSDPHVRPENMLYRGVVDSNTMFAAAVRHVNSLDPLPDLVLLSGDLVDKGTPEEYAMLRKLLAQLEAPVLAIPGNHDDREVFRRAFSDQAYLPATGPINYAVGDRGAVRIIALDVTIPGRHHGAVEEAGTHWLEAALAAEPDRPTIIMMHQPPFECGVPYLDAYLCRYGEQLAHTVSRYPSVERIVCGHVHRFMQLKFGGTILCTAPSTTTAIALQLKPDAAAKSFIEPPACSLHHWRPTTGLITHFSPIGVFPGPYPFA